MIIKHISLRDEVNILREFFAANKQPLSSPQAFAFLSRVVKWLHNNHQSSLVQLHKTGGELDGDLLMFVRAVGLADVTKVVDLFEVQPFCYIADRLDEIYTTILSDADVPCGYADVSILTNGSLAHLDILTIEVVGDLRLIEWEKDHIKDGVYV